MEINKKGLDLIKKSEGLRLHSYADVAGVWTIGYGHTKDVRPSQFITEQEAENFLKADIAWAEQAVENLVQVPLNSNEFSALVSLVFNIGEQHFKTSTLLRKLNDNDRVAARKQFERWSYAGGDFVPGLKARRLKELELFNDVGP